MAKVKKSSLDSNGQQVDKPKFTRHPNRATERVNSENSITYYANSVEVAFSVWDFRMKCGEMLEASAEKLVVKDLCTVYMSPSHAKAVAILLDRKVKEYENQFGAVPIPPL